MNKLFLSLALVVSLLVLVAVLPVEGASYDIYYRFLGRPRPGSELILQLAMSKRGPEVRPIGNVEFNVTVENGRPISVRADETGVAEVRVKIPLSMLLGGVMRVHVKAYSDFYAASAESTIALEVEPDYFGLACICLASLSVILPVVICVVRR